MFDGVHLGHQEILKLINKEAQKVGGESVLLTFSPHPRIVLQANTDLKLLTTEEEKTKKLEKHGLDHLIIQSFTPDFFKLSALEFVRDYLVDSLGMHTLVIGHDHHFGKNREGNFERLLEWSVLFGYNLIELPAVLNNGMAISSTKIRAALLEGDLPQAKISLNEDYSVEGEIIEGDKIGRTIGHPTANLKPLDSYKLIPSNGAYAVKVLFENTLYLGMANIGIRPTVNGLDKRIEVNIFNFNQDIYHKNLRIIFLEKLRDEKKFASLDELKSELYKNKQQVIEKYNLQSI